MKKITRFELQKECEKQGYPYVAMDEGGDWWGYTEKPVICSNSWDSETMYTGSLPIRDIATDRNYYNSDIQKHYNWKHTLTEPDSSQPTKKYSINKDDYKAVPELREDEWIWCVAEHDSNLCRGISSAFKGNSSGYSCVGHKTIFIRKEDSEDMLYQKVFELQEQVEELTEEVVELKKSRNALADEPVKKPIEFVYRIDQLMNKNIQDRVIEASMVDPSQFSNVELLVKGNKHSEYDVMVAYWHDEVYIYLGYYNDGDK